MEIKIKGGTDNAGATLYYGGDILTMEGDEAQYVEAVVVEAGKIAFVGNRAEAEKKFAHARKLDLAGRTLLPGFIDAHGHVWVTGFQALSANLLPPPDGAVNTIPALIEQMNEWKAQQ